MHVTVASETSEGGREAWEDETRRVREKSDGIKENYAVQVQENSKPVYDTSFLHLPTAII